MKRVVVWCWPKDPSLGPIEALQKSGEVEVVAWFSRGRKKTHLTKHFSYQPKRLLRDLQQQEPDHRDIPEFAEGELAREFHRFQDIYSRVNYSKGQDYFQHLNLFHLYYRYFTRLLRKGEVDAVIFFNAPHVGADFVLYCAAKRLGLKTIITLQSPLPNRFFGLEDIDDFGTFATAVPSEDPIELTIPRQHEKEHFYMQKIPKKRGLLISRLLRDCFWATFGGRQPLSWAGVLQKQIGRNTFSALYRKHALAEVDFDRKFVYFPLQLQPELTTATIGGAYSDQLLAMEALSKILPDDWHIYAKENPKQGFQQRNRFFFERLARIPNCHYLSAEIDTYTLMKQCRFVASITGTACWESVTGGKPALIFGNIWFKHLPGITAWRDGLTVSDIVDQEIDHARLEEEYSRVMSKTHKGIIAMAYTKLHPEFDPKENVELLTRFLRRALAHQPGNP